MLIERPQGFYVLLVCMILFSVSESSAADTDLDGIEDNIDNCLNAANPDQVDADGDGFGNWCDGDFTNDGLTNFSDLGALRAMFGTVNAADLDGNGSVGFSDVARFRQLFGKSPGPSAVGCNPQPTTSATLSWTAPETNADGSPLLDLAGYRVYHSDDPALKPVPLEVTGTSLLIGCLAPGTWYFVATAVDEAGNESVFSSVAQKVIK